MKKQINVSVQVAEHIPSGCLLIGNKWEIDPTDEDIIRGANTDYCAYADIVDEDDDGYDADNCEQEHAEDYRIINKEYTIEYRDEEDEDGDSDSINQEYKENKENFEKNRDSYYGYCNGNRREFSKMYGNGDYTDFAEWIMHNKDYTII